MCYFLYNQLLSVCTFIGFCFFWSYGHHQGGSLLLLLSSVMHTVTGVINSNARVGSISAMVDVVRVMFLGKLRSGTALAFALDSRPKAIPANAGEWLLTCGNARCEHRIECHG